MGLTYEHEKEGGTVARYTVDRHLYLTEDGSRVVEENNPAGRWLWASPGTDVDMDEAVRLGAVKSEPEPAPEEEPKAEETETAPKARAVRPPNKARPKAEDK